VSIAGPTTGTVGTAVTFTATGSGGTTAYTFAWTATGGTPASGTGASFSTTYSVKGAKTVSVTITDANTATSTASATISISTTLLGVTVTGPTTGTAGTAVTFTATATGGTSPFTFAWTATGGTPASGSGASFSTTYSVKGTKTVSVTVTDANTATATASATITIAPASPLAVTVSGPTAAMVGTMVTFTATGSGGTTPYTFAWTANGGTPSSGTGTSFSTTYNVKGTYSVMVTVTDGNANTATMSASITIAPFPLTIALLEPTTGGVGQVLSFIAQASGGTAPYTFAWTAPGGTPPTGTGSNFSVSYAVKGTYVVTARVTDGNSNTATASVTLTIAPLALTASFTFTPTSPTNGTAVTFTASASGGTGPYSFAWIFGDGATGTGSPVSHTYLVAGNFTVILTTTDANAAKVNASRTVQVTLSVGVPISAVDFQPTHTIVGDTTFVSQVTGGTAPFSCMWSFGDSTPAQTGCLPVHTYTASGSYSVTLTVTDSRGSMGTKTKMVTVDPAPLLTKKIKWQDIVDFSHAELFRTTVNNPSSFTITATLSINIFSSSGGLVAKISSTVTLAPGASTQISLSWSEPAIAADYSFIANVNYSASLGTFNGTPMMVTGTAGTGSGNFEVIPTAHG